MKGVWRERGEVHAGNNNRKLELRNQRKKMLQNLPENLHVFKFSD